MTPLNVIKSAIRRAKSFGERLRSIAIHFSPRQGGFPHEFSIGRENRMDNSAFHARGVEIDNEMGLKVTLTGSLHCPRRVLYPFVTRARHCRAPASSQRLELAEVAL